MAEDNVKAQMRKGILEYCILAILSRGDSYAPRIIAELKAAARSIRSSPARKTPVCLPTAGKNLLRGLPANITR